MQAAGGRALIVGGWVRDDLLGQPPKDLRSRGLRVAGGPAARRAGTLRPGRCGRRELRGLQESATSTSSLPRRESKTGRGHKGFHGRGRSAPLDRGCGAAPRFHDQRDLARPADGRDRSIRSTAAPTSAARRLRVVDAGPLRRRQPARAARDSVRRAIRADGGCTRRRTVLPRDPARRSARRSAIWGEVEKLLLRARRPSIGLALALELGVVDRPLARAGRARRLSAGAGVASGRRRLGAHVDGRRRGAVADGRPRTRPGGRDDARRQSATTSASPRRRRSSTAASDRPGHEEAGVAPATSLLDRLNVHTLDGYDVRRAVLGLVAHHLKPSAFMKAPTPVSDGAFRRLAQKVDLELLARFAKADCHGRTGPLRLLRDGLVPRTCARARRRARAAARRSSWAGICSTLGVPPGPRWARSSSRFSNGNSTAKFATLEEGLALARKIVRVRQAGRGEARRTAEAGEKAAKIR